jgi:hypothetical protein
MGENSPILVTLTEMHTDSLLSGILLGISCLSEAAHIETTKNICMQKLVIRTGLILQCSSFLCHIFWAKLIWGKVCMG